MLERDGSSLFGEEHRAFRDSVRRFIAREFSPHLEEFEEAGIVSREFWAKAGEAGLLCPTLPEEYGGPGLDFTFNTILNEEFTYAMMSDSVTLQSDITMPYILRYASDELKQRWLPKMIAGEVIAAIAMTEPGAGSDLQGVRTSARRDGDEFIINGSKTYITNGQNADIILTVCKTNPEAGAKGTSLILVEADRPGFSRGRNLDKVGQWMADTSELFYEDVRVPAGNVLGEVNRGFIYLVSDLPQERLSISITAQAAAQRAFEVFPKLPTIASTLRETQGADACTLGAVVFTRAGEEAHAPPRRLNAMVDRIGGGDAFAAGVLHGVISGMGAQQTVEFALAASILKHAIPGDFNLSSVEDIAAMTASGGSDVRR